MSTHNNSPKEKPVDVNNVSEESAVVNNAPETGGNHIPEKTAKMTSSEWIAEYWKGINRGNDVPCCPRKMTSADKKFSEFGKDT